MLAFSVSVFALLCALFGSSAHGAPDMAFPGRHWEEATPASQGVAPDKLAVAVQFLERNAGSDGIKEVVIVRNGRLIWKGTDIDKVHGVWSCTKSFTSTVLGLLIDVSRQ